MPNICNSSRVLKGTILIRADSQQGMESVSQFKVNTVNENYWLIYMYVHVAATVIRPCHVGYYFQSLKQSKPNTPIPWPVDHEDFVPLTSSHRISYKHAIFVGTAIGECLNTHCDFCVFWPGALSTRHPWRAIARADVCTRNRFSEFVGSRFGGPTVRWPQTKGTASNERVHSFVDFCIIHLSKTCSFDVPAKNL